MRCLWLMFAVLAACGPHGSPADASVDPADLASDTPLPRITSLCGLSDGDRVAAIPAATKTPACVDASTDAPEGLFADVGTLAGDYAALHGLCLHMNPAPGTRDDLADAQLAADLHAYLVSLTARPALQTVLAALPADADARANALAAVWLPSNGFEHVLCGELAPNGQVGGLHMWSEYYAAEREKRADYRCTGAGVDDPDVVAFKYAWQPPGAIAFATKPLGSMFVGASPACLLALGYTAIDRGIPPGHGDTPAFVGEIYGVSRDWVFGASDGTIVTLYPHAR